MLRWQFCLKLQQSNLKYTICPDEKEVKDKLYITDYDANNIEYLICTVKYDRVIFNWKFLTDLCMLLFMMPLNSLTETRYSVSIKDVFALFVKRIEWDNFFELFPLAIEAVKLRDSYKIFNEIEILGDDLYWSIDKSNYLTYVYENFCISDTPVENKTDTEVLINILAPRCLYPSLVIDIDSGHITEHKDADDGGFKNYVKNRKEFDLGVGYEF